MNEQISKDRDLLQTSSAVAAKAVRLLRLSIAEAKEANLESLAAIPWKASEAPALRP